MPYKSIFGGGGIAQQPGVDTILSHYQPGKYAGINARIKKREDRRDSLINRGLDQGLSWEDISKKTRIPLERVQAFSHATRPDYGIQRNPSIGDRAASVGRGAKSLGSEIARPFKTVATGTARALGAGDETQGQEAAAKSLDATRDKIIRLLQDPNIPKSRKNTLMKALNIESLDTVNQVTEQRKQIEKDTNPKRFAGAVAEVSSYLFGGEGLGQAFKAGGKAGLSKALLETGFSGAVGGGGSVLEKNPDAGLEDIAKGAGIGSALGVGAAGASAALGGGFRAIKNGIGNQATRVSPHLTAVTENATQQTIKSTTARAGGGNKTQAVSVTTPSTSMTPTLPTSEKYIGTGNPVTTALAKNTEARAIENDLTKGFNAKATFNKSNGQFIKQQADAVVDFMDQDYDTAKAVAFGEASAPKGVVPEAVYKGVEARATREGDVATIAQLANSKVATRASVKGQELSALANKDPESPVTALQAIAKARKESKLDIPKKITPEEADTITQMAQRVAEAKDAIVNGGDRLAYGRARVAYDQFIQDLIAKANKKTVKESLKPGNVVNFIAGNSKAIKASLDNSAIFRQGWKTMMTNPVLWQRNARKSFADIVKTFGGKDTLREVAADIVSRPNADLYRKMKLDVFGITEEAFPTALPERIPLLGRAYKASEAAYTGFVQKQRADVADKVLETAQRAGVNLDDPKQLVSIGKMVNSLTGRGHLGKLEPSARVVNNVFFSPRNLKANIDTLTAHQFQKGVTPFVRKQAAKNLLRVVGGTAAILATAGALKPGSVEWDPRSSNFGKVKLGNTRFDVTGGMASILTLASRLVTQSSKSSTTNEVSKLNSGKYGGRTTWDVLLDFGEGKAAPATSVVIDLLKGETFSGDKPTVANEAKNLLQPLITSTWQNLRSDPKSANDLLSIIADGLGISANNYAAQKDWNRSTSKQLLEFKKSVGQDKFNEASTRYNQQYNDWYDRVQKSGQAKNLSQSDREKLINEKRKEITDQILQSYGFTYKMPAKPQTDNNVFTILKNL